MLNGLEAVMEDDARQQRLAAMAETMRSTDAATMDGYRAETAVWEALGSDLDQ